MGRGGGLISGLPRLLPGASSSSQNFKNLGGIGESLSLPEVLRICSTIHENSGRESGFLVHEASMIPRRPIVPAVKGIGGRLFSSIDISTPRAGIS